MPTDADALLAGLPPLPKADAQASPGGDDLLAGLPPLEGQLPQTTAIGAAGRAAATSVVPSAAALIGSQIGGYVGAAAGALVPGAGETGASEAAGWGAGKFVGNAIGAFIGGLLGDKVQSAALKEVAPSVHSTLEKYQAADQEQHPYAAFAGDVAGGATIFKLAPLEAARGAASLIIIARGETTWKALKEPERQAVQALAIQTGMGAAFGAAGSLVEGQAPTFKGITSAVAQAMLLGHPRDWTGAGEKAPQAAVSAPPAPPAPAPPAPQPPSIDPAASYDVSPERKAIISQIVSREQSGKLTPDDVSQLGQLQSDDSLGGENEFYINERQRQRNQAAAATPLAPSSESPVTPALPPNSPLASADVAPAAPVASLPVAPPAPAPAPSSVEIAKAAPVAVDDQASLRLGNTPAATAPAPAVDRLTEARNAISNTPVADKLDEEAQKVQASPAPTEAQKQAGNYVKGHVKIGGLDVTIENPAGSIRSGTDASGKEWSVKMPGDYGYVKGTEGKDGDHVDVTIGPNPDGFQKAWVIDQLNADGGFDEHKALLGYNSKDDALAAYRASFSDGKADERIGGVTEMPKQDFENWVKSGDTTKPLAAKPPVESWRKVKATATAEQIHESAQGAFEAGAGDKSVSTGDASLENKLGAASLELRAALKKRDKDIRGGADPVVAEKEFQERVASLKVKRGGEVGVERVGAGQETAKAYEPLRGMTLEQAKARAYDDSASKTGKNGSTTKKLVALRAPDDSHVVLGQAYRTGGVDRVTMYDANGKPKVRNFDDLVKKDGWQPLATIKQKDYSKNFLATFSPEEWSRLENTLWEKESETSKAAALLDDHHAEMSSELGKPHDSATVEEAKNSLAESADGRGAKLESDDLPPPAAAAGPASIAPESSAFTSDHAEDIFDALHGLGVESPEDVFQIIKQTPELGMGFRALARDLGLQIKTESEARVAINLASRILYEAFTEAQRNHAGAGRARVQFIESVRKESLRRGGSDSVSGGVQPAADRASSGPATAGRGSDAAQVGAGKDGGRPSADAAPSKPANDAAKPAPKPAKSTADTLGGRLSEALKKSKGDVDSAIESLPATDQAKLDKLIGSDFEEHSDALSLLAKGKNPFGDEYAPLEGTPAHNIDAYLASLDKGSTVSTRYRIANEKDAYHPEQLPPEAKRAIDGTHIGAAHTILEGVHRASAEAGAKQPTRGTERTALDEKIRPKETAALLMWAKANGLMIDRANFDKNWKAGGKIEGMENRAYPDGHGNWIKANDGSAHGTWLHFFDRIALHNSLFPETKLEFIGFMEGGKRDGKSVPIEPVFKQKDVSGRGATPAEVKADMARRGYQLIPGKEFDYYNPRTGIILGDAHDENSIVTPSGIAFIDAIPNMAQPEDFKKPTMVVNGQRLGGGKLSMFTPPMTRERAKVVISQHVISDAQAHLLVPRIIHALRARGIETRLLAPEIAGMAKDCAKMEVWKNDKGSTSKAITVALEDTTKPTANTVISLLHEAGHCVFADETPETQALLHQAIDGATNEALGIGSYEERVAPGEQNPAAVKQEGRLVESIAQKLALSGFDPEEARSAVQRIAIAVRELYQRVAMGLIKAMGLTPSPERAAAYFEARMRSFLSGKGMSLTSFMGGPRMAEVNYDSPASVMTRYRDVSFVSDPKWDISADRNSTAVNTPKAAAMNELGDAIETIHRAVLEEGHLPQGMGIDDFTRAIGLPVQIGDVKYFGKGETPATKIAEGNKALQSIGQTLIDPSIKVADIADGASKQQASAIARNLLEATRTTLAAKARDVKSEVNANAHALTKDIERHATALTEYRNLDLIYAQAKLRMSDLIGMTVKDTQAIRDAAGEIGKTARKIGALDQILRQLDTDIKGDNPLPEPYVKALDALAKKLAGGKDYSDTLQALASAMGDMDWVESTPGDIRNSLQAVDLSEVDNGHLIEPLLEKTPEARALLATAISFAKGNAHLMDLLALRQVDAAGDRSSLTKELTEANKIIHNATQGGDSAISDARNMAKKLPRLAVKMDRLLRHLQELKTSVADRQMRVENGRKFIEIQRLADPILKRAAAEHEARIGLLRNDFQPVHGAKMMIPPNAGARPDAFVQRSLNLSKDGTTSPEVADSLNKMADWLKLSKEGEANPQLLALHGADYLGVKQQYDRLMLAQVRWGIHDSIQGSFVTRFLAPITDKLRSIGTPSSRMAASMIERSQVLIRSVMGQAHQYGSEYESQRDRAMVALGIARPEVFDKTILRDFANALEHRKDLNSVEEGIRAGMEHLRLDDATKEMMGKPGATAAVEKWMRLHVEIAEWGVKTGAWMGNKVLDGNTYRDVIGNAPTTLPRQLSSEAETLFLKMGEWAKEKLTKAGVRFDASQDIEKLRESLKSRFTPEQRFFVSELCKNKQGRSAFYAPEEGGINRFATRERVATAYEMAGGDLGFDPIKFSEMLYKLEGGKADPAKFADFVGETMETFQSYYDLLSASRSDYSDLQDNGHPSPKRFIMDARKCEEMPAGFYDYLPFDKTTLTQLTKSQAYNAAFGRRMTAMRETLQKAEAEQLALAKQYEDLKALYPDLKGKKLRDAIRGEMKSQGLDQVIMENAQRNAKSVAANAKQIESVLGMNRNRPPEQAAFAEIMGAIAAGTVSGPGTAITAHEVIFEQWFRKFGFNTAGLRLTASATEEIAKVAFGSLLQAFHRQAFWDTRLTKLNNTVGVFDDDATLSIKDKWRSALVHPIYAENQMLRGVIMAGRLAKTALTVGVGRAQEGKAVFPTLKPLSVFHWAAQVIQLGGANAWAKIYEGNVMAGVEHFASHPEDLANKDFQFTAKHLGWPEGRAFDYLKSSMTKYGMTFEQLTRDAVARREADSTAPLLHQSTYRYAAQQCLDDMTMESSLTTRPTWLMTNSLGQMANPMLGWAVHKGYDAVRGFREPNGQKSYSAFGTGLAAYAAILPIGMAFAMLRNKFDEDVLGRKQNVEDLTTIHDPKSALLTVCDNASRIGTFGVFGEVPNYWLNRDSGVRPISIDSRVFFLSTILNTQNAIMNLVHQRSMDYATVVRPLLQSLGGNGFLQYAGALNHALSLDDAEARVTGRISVNNYLRVAGRELNLDVRTMNGTMQMASSPSPIKPLVGKMLMAAYANNANDFQEAKREAIQAQLAMLEDDKKMTGKDKNLEAQKKVAQAFADSSPLRSVFKTLPTEYEYRKMIAGMDSQGRESVATAINLFQHYGQQIGATGGVFARSVAPTSLAHTLTLNDARERMIASPISGRTF